MSELIREIRQAARALARSPRFSLTIVLTLALGIGINVADFSIVNSFLFRPQPYRDADELVHLWRADRKRGIDKMRFSFPTFLEIEERCASCAGAAAYYYYGANLAGGDSLPESLTVSNVTADMFGVLGVDAALGRTFSEEDETRGKTVILSHGIWQRRFAGREEVIGERVELNDESFTVVGVMPAEFNFPFGGVKAWTVVEPHLERWDRDFRNFMPVVRLAPGATRERLAAEVSTIFRGIAEEHHPDQLEASAVYVEPLRQALLFLSDMIHLLLALLTVSTLFVLLIICTNIANLFLVRAVGREREVAVRAALGAGRLPLVRQLLAEGLVLALAGGGLGVLFAYWLLGLAAPAIPEDLYRVGEIGIDGASLAVSLLISVLTVGVFALPPALQTLKADLGLALKEGSAGAGSGRKARRAQNLLVVAQVALAAVLLIGTVLAVRSFANMDGVDPGFDPERVLTMGMTLPSASFGDERKVAEFQRQVLDRVEALPGVVQAAFTSPLPMNFESWGIEFTIEGRDDAAGDKLSAGLQYVSPDYFRTMGVSLLQGRDFSQRDRLEEPRVAVFSRSMAERFWPQGSPIGERIRFDLHGEEATATIVGVVADTKRMFLNDDEQALVYLSQAQRPLRGPFLVVKTAGEPLAMAPQIREQIWSVRPNLPLSAIRSMRQVVDESLRPWSWSAKILGAFSVFALLLAAIGIYGVVAYAASQRTTEIGVRMAMGARPADILRFVLERALLLAAIGVVAGGAASLALSRAMGSILYGVTAGDPATYAGVLLLLGTVAVAAALAPALRAARLDPAIALRHE